MPCQHLAQIQQLQLPVSDSDVLKVICPVCGNVDVCAYTPLKVDEPESEINSGKKKPCASSQAHVKPTSNSSTAHE